MAISTYSKRSPGKSNFEELRIGHGFKKSISYNLPDESGTNIGAQIIDYCAI